MGQRQMQTMFTPLKTAHRKAEIFNTTRPTEVTVLHGENVLARTEKRTLTSKARMQPTVCSFSEG